ncbi:MAG TPA: hypothetical protein VG013_02705, partial [Gemmataceae bacterium]|nr:hypothetical protein [Gemmataceae bacterium]
LLQVLELSQKNNLHELCDDELAHRLAEEIVPKTSALAPTDRPADLSQQRMDSVWDGLEHRLLDGLSIPENRCELQDLVTRERTRHLAATREGSQANAPAAEIEQTCAEAVRRLRDAVGVWARDRWPPRVCALLLSPPAPTAGAALYRRMLARYEAEKVPAVNPR